MGFSPGLLEMIHSYHCWLLPSLTLHMPRRQQKKIIKKKHLNVESLFRTSRIWSNICVYIGQKLFFPLTLQRQLFGLMVCSRKYGQPSQCKSMNVTIVQAEFGCLSRDPSPEVRLILQETFPNSYWEVVDLLLGNRVPPPQFPNDYTFCSFTLGL